MIRTSALILTSLVLVAFADAQRPYGRGTPGTGGNVPRLQCWPS
jgi:hypothetical protein